MALVWSVHIPEVSPEKTGISADPHLGARQTWRLDIVPQMSWPGHQGLLSSPWWSEDLSSKVLSSSLFLRTKTLSKIWKPIGRRENISIDLQGLVLIYTWGNGPGVISTPQTVNCHQQHTSSEHPRFTSPTQSPRYSCGIPHLPGT